MISSVTEQEVDDLLCRAAAAVLQRRMTVPAVFFLEMYKPLTTCIQAAVVFSLPLLVPLFGSRLALRVVKVLDSRDNVEKLIRLLEKETFVGEDAGGGN